MTSTEFLPYGRQSIDEEEIRAVVDVLRSDRLTQGPLVEAFEAALARYCGAQHAIERAAGRFEHRAKGREDLLRLCFDVPLDQSIRRRVDGDLTGRVEQPVMRHGLRVRTDRRRRRSAEGVQTFR